MTAVRTEVIDALLELFRSTDGIRDLDYLDAFDIDEISQECVWVGDIDGTDEYDLVMGGTDVMFNADFQVEFGILSATPGQTAGEARARCEGYLNAMRRAIAGDVGLGGVVLDSLDVTTGTASGPDAIPSEEGWGAGATLTVVVSASMQGA